MNMRSDERLTVANKVMPYLHKSARIEKRRGGYWVCWKDWRGKQVEKRFSVDSKGRLWPAWHRHWPSGGTSCNALSLLMRWVRDEPVWGLAIWEHWASDRIKLVPQEVVSLLGSSGWTERSECIFCGEGDHFDWYIVGGRSGPGCWHGTGCKKVREEVA